MIGLRTPKAIALGGLLALFGGLSPARGQAGPLPKDRDPFEKDRTAAAEEQILLQSVEGPITSRLAGRVVERLRTAPERWPRARTVVFTLDTDGGELAAAGEIAELMARDLKGYLTVARVPPGASVRGEGLLLVFAAQKIVLGKDSVLGGGPGPERGAAAELKELVRKYASERGHSPALADAMVSGEHEELLRVRLAPERPGSEETVLIMTRQDLDDRLKGKPDRLLGEKTLVGKGQLLELTTEKAREYKLTRHVADDVTQIQLELGLAVAPENVIDLDEPAQPRTAVDLLNLPFVRFLLILCGALAVLIELKTLGTLIPGTIALLCFAVFFVAHSLPVSGAVEGTASLWEVLLFVLGAGLLAMEFLLLPGVAIFGILGGALCAVSLVLAMVPSASSGASVSVRGAVEEAIAILAYGFLAAFACFLLLVRFISHRPGLARRGLVSTSAIVGVPTADSALAAQAAQQGLVGSAGSALTALRPAGKVRLEDGTVLDVVAEGEFIEAGTPVKVIQCDGGITRVSRLEA